MSFVAKSMLLLLLFFLSHHVHSSSKIKFLPGFEGPLPFEIETGYIGIGEEEEIQSFYYFFESENNPKEDPLLIWLSGGPGVSSINGLFLENGPLSFKIEPYNGTIPTLVLRTCSWTKMANILYLDQPVGAGFSYSKIPLGKTGDTDQVNKILEFLQKWLRKHPQFYYNHFYVGGDSYAGKIIPALVQKISKAHLDQRRTTLHVRHFQNGHTDLSTTRLTTTNDYVYTTYDSNGHSLRSTNSGNYLYCEPPINLQGYILGNPVTHFAVEKNYRIPFAHGMALISNELYESMNRICKGNYEKVSPQNKECLRLIENYHKCIDKINEMNILIPQCDQTIPDCYYHLYYLLEKWANNEKTREALHIRKRTVDEWVRFRTIPYVRDIESSVPYHKNNSISGYKSLIFSGDHDFQLPYLATEAWIKSLNYSIIDDWRPWMIKNQIAGYTRSYANKMTFATVKGGGHTAEYKQHETFIMFQRWIKGQPLQ